MTYTTFKLVNSTFRISIGADPNTKVGLLPQFDRRQQMPAKGQTL